jgi:hypothetical protein
MRQSLSLLVRSLGISLLAAGLCGTLSAATVSKLNDDVLAPLRNTVGAKQIHLSSVPLYAHGTAKIDLEEFQVWAPDGKVIVDDGRSVTYLDPPPMRFFRGVLNGDPESFAYFSVDGTTGAIYGLIATRDGKFSVGAARRKPLTRGQSQTGEDFDYFLAASDESDEIPMIGRTWECENEKLPPISQINRRMLVQTDASGQPVIAQGISGTQAYAIAVEVETDSELYISAGSNSTTLTNYVTNLTGAVSTIYNRDIHTNVVQQNLHIYIGGNGSDPWAATDANSGLIELGDYYHANNLSLKRSAVIMLSGKNTLSGVAWLGTIGGGDFSAGGGDFGGSYAWCGSIGTGGLGSIPDPNATNGAGTVYGMPTGFQNYWPLEEYAHELGHNLAGHHTHCVAITNAERTAAGFTDGSPSNSTSNFVDHCYGTAAADFGEVGCYSGSNYVAGSQGTYKGTIMGYCHNVFLSSVPQSRFTFGQASEPSHHELDDYLLSAGGPGANGGNYNIVTAVGTFSMTGPTGASNVAANSTGNTASVSTSNGATVTYLWTITGGTITAGATSATVTYTAGASGSVVLRATAYNTPAGSNSSAYGPPGFPWNTTGVTDTKTVTITTVSPPTNVVATALTSTSVQISWTAASGATKYEISRSANNSTFTAVCVVASTCPTSSPFTDSTASANTAYIYKVKSVDSGSNLSAFSNGDLATTVIFTDPSLVQNTTKVKLVHMNELRTAITAVCTLAANPTPCSTAFTDPSLTTSTNVKVLHLTELRAKLNASRTALALTAQSYAEGSITTATTIKAAQINELRNGVQ